MLDNKRKSMIVMRVVNCKHYHDDWVGWENLTRITLYKQMSTKLCWTVPSVWSGVV